MGFKSAKEAREVFDRVFTLMSTDPDMGPKLRDAETPQRFEFPDFDLVVNVTYSDDDGSDDCLKWEWTDDVAWKPEVSMEMSSEVANRYFQGKENIAMAIAPDSSSMPLPTATSRIPNSRTGIIGLVANRASTTAKTASRSKPATAGPATATEAQP